jgi:predicted kinase
MPKLYMLIGVPGSGKSTWACNQEWYKDCSHISTDSWIELEAKRQGKTYSDVFDEYISKATHIMNEHIKLSVYAEQDIIWDQTNMSSKSRAKKLAMVPNYEKIAVVFRTPEKVELLRRLSNRPGKFISEGVLNNMINSYNEPTVEEGFKEIWYV